MRRKRRRKGLFLLFSFHSLDFMIYCQHCLAFQLAKPSSPLPHSQPLVKSNTPPLSPNLNLNSGMGRAYLELCPSTYPTLNQAFIPSSSTETSLSSPSNLHLAKSSGQLCLQFAQLLSNTWPKIFSPLEIHSSLVFWNILLSWYSFYLNIVPTYFLLFPFSLQTLFGVLQDPDLSLHVFTMYILSLHELA